MPFLKVTGGPVAPSGKTLNANTRLVVTFEEPYVDGIYSYPTNHFASLDTTTGKWKPLGSVNGIDFYLPGGATAYPRPPKCILKEVQEFTDGTSRSFIRGPIRIYASTAGEWFYATPESGAIYVTDPAVPLAGALLTTDLGIPSGVASLNANSFVAQLARPTAFRVTVGGTLFAGPSGWSWNRTGVGIYSLTHDLNSTNVAWAFSILYSDTASLDEKVLASSSANPNNVSIRAFSGANNPVDPEFWGIAMRIN